VSAVGPGAVCQYLMVRVSGLTTAPDPLAPLATVRFRQVQFGRSLRHGLRDVVYAAGSGDLSTMSAESRSALGRTDNHVQRPAPTVVICSCRDGGPFSSMTLPSGSDK
jgi:hypothetical protein